jgi:monothiol glutaredoxin
MADTVSQVITCVQGGCVKNSPTDNPFNIAATPDRPEARGIPMTETGSMVDPAERVRAMVGSADVFLLIKGTPRQPQCGFSANTVAVMDALDVPYRTFDVLSDESIRDAAKQFAGWPTFPQVYVRGEFIGGNDIVTEMYHDGELHELVKGIAS